jgi:acetyl/propionyl-CoA carboxylase alpha subunit
MGISTVAVFSEPDAGEPHTHEADEAVLLPGSSASETYLDVDAVLAAAKETGADAIHPGYGFLSENAGFAATVAEAGLTWIGPSPDSIEVMGSKLESKRLIEAVQVPTLESVELDEDVDAAAEAARIGFPVLVKASAGGGGKGMRIVPEPDGLDEAIESARREAASAFGDDTVFLEKYLEAPRHIEIQVFGDTHGNVISLFERECSIQRRHQKIVEESPSPVIDAVTRDLMGQAAVATAKAVDYVGAGTVEFLYQDGEFFFLEMNTRLQVEHPVTEMITGLDLVRLQIEVASGGTIPEQPTAINGHAVEARVYAEDPLNDFLPVTGLFHRFSVPSGQGIRVDSGIEDGSVVTVHYDPMIAKVIAHAPTRESAATVLATALRRARIHGSTTNRALLVRILEHPEFLAGATDTHFLERHDPAYLGRPLARDVEERQAAVACALADQSLERGSATVLSTIGSGWRNSPSQLQHRAYEGHEGIIDVHYSAAEFDVEGVGRIALIDVTASAVSIAIDDVEHHYEVARYGAQRYVDSDAGPVRLVEAPRFPSTDAEDAAGSLHAPMPGKVIALNAEVGEAVTDGQVLVVMEAMKMEHSLRSPHDGTVIEVRHLAGDQVEADEVLVVVEEG